MTDLCMYGVASQEVAITAQIEEELLRVRTAGFRYAFPLCPTSVHKRALRGFVDATADSPSTNPSAVRLGGGTYGCVYACSTSAVSLNAKRLLPAGTDDDEEVEPEGMVDVAVKCPLHAEYHKYIVCEKTTHLVVGPSLYIVKLLATTNVNVEDQYRKRKSPADVLVSERWEGTLNDFKADQACPMDVASPFVVILCVARALKHLARFNLAHTDLSTGNIAVRTVDRRNAAGSFVRLIACAAVLDLQMCKQWGYPFAPQEVALRASCAYNAPDRNVNPRTDVYSLGPALSERTGLMRFPTSAPSRNDLFVVRTREFCNSCMNPNYEDRPSIEDCERFALAGLVQLKAHRAGPSTA